MAYDERLADEVRGLVAGEDALAELKMFGGLCFTSRGNMICGVVGAELMVRVARDGFAALLREPHTRPMDFTGKPMQGFLFVAEPAWSKPATLARWIARSVAYARTLPAKPPRPRRAPGPPKPKPRPRRR